MRLRACGSLFVALALLSPSATMAQRVKPADRGPWEITGFVGTFDDTPEYRSKLFVDPSGNPLFGAGLRDHLSQGFFLGAEGRFAALDLARESGGFTNLNALSYGGLLGYTLPLHERLDLYAVGGVSAAYWNASDIGGKETDLAFTYGGGVRLYLTENISLDGDYRMLQVPDAMGTLSSSIGGQTSDETFWGWSLSGGVSWFFGSKDADGDGVGDGDDACPDTPRGVEVDARGCPVDTDGDGVADYQDRCPDTPAGASVDGQGCPIDSDNDGVFDGLDRCPNTPAGATVDGQGCPVDSDDDGVYDGLDRCPGTPAGTRVDAVGCPFPEPEPEPEPRVFTLSGFEGDVNFGFDSAELTTQGQATLRQIGDTLVTADELGTIAIEGHTDSVGADDYNLDLSRRRAEAVRDFLRENFPQLADTQFTVRGFGETQPVTSNDTDQGRAQNRRVEIRVGG
jgi:OOP family OmpA-OmpF porin